MASTTLKAITDAMQTALNAVALTDGRTWARILGSGLPDELNAVDHDAHYFIGVGEGEKVDPDYGLGGQQTMNAKLQIMLFRDISGADSEDALLVFQDDARKAAAAIDKYGGYPAATDLVLAGSVLITTDGDFARAELAVTLIFDAAY